MSREKAKTAVVGDVKLLQFRSFAEPNGTLVPLTGGREIPFPIARVFYIHSVGEGITRGEHAHIECQQLLVCLHGACEVIFEDGMTKRSLTIDSPGKGVHIPAGIWTMQKYLKRDSVLVVFTDRQYDENDYIREYGAYLEFRGIARKRAVNE